jgi:hypothetical protein
MNKKRVPDLIAEITQEIESIDRIHASISAVYKKLQLTSENSEEFLESLAFKLHNFYTACEKIFKRVAEDINGGLPDSFDWHRRLLETASLEIVNVRPPIITKETMFALNDYLAFRHVVRNIYGFELRRDKVEVLLNSIDAVYNKLKHDITIFVEFLKALV